MKKDTKVIHRRSTCDRLLRVWNQMPELTFGELLSCSDDLDNLSDEQIIQKCVGKIKFYRAERSLKNKLRKGFKTCVTKMTLW